METKISVLAAFGAGLLSFFSPCVLPLIPAYLSFITGISIDKKRTRTVEEFKKIFLNSLLFVLGFSLIFILLGASATGLGRFLLSRLTSLSLLAGVIVILLALLLSGIFPFAFLQREKRIHLRKKPLGLFGSLLVGVIFSLGWTPCVGPLLGSILAISATRDHLWEGITLLSFYSLGLGIPFLISSLLIAKFFTFYRAIGKFFDLIQLTSSKILLILGITMVSGRLSMFTAGDSISGQILFYFLIFILILSFEVWLLRQIQKMMQGTISVPVRVLFFLDVVGFCLAGVMRGIF